MELLVHLPPPSYNFTDVRYAGRQGSPGRQLGLQLLRWQGGKVRECGRAIHTSGQRLSHAEAGCVSYSSNKRQSCIIVHDQRLIRVVTTHRQGSRSSIRARSDTPVDQIVGARRRGQHAHRGLQGVPHRGARGCGQSARSGNCALHPQGKLPPRGDAQAESGRVVRSHAGRQQAGAGQLRDCGRVVRGRQCRSVRGLIDFVLICSSPTR